LRGQRVGCRLGLVVLLPPAGEHLDVGGHDLGLPVPRAAIVVPRARLEAALDRDLLALAEVLAADFGQPVPRDDVVELRLLLAVRAVRVRGHTELGQGAGSTLARSELSCRLSVVIPGRRRPNVPEVRSGAFAWRRSWRPIHG